MNTSEMLHVSRKGKVNIKYKNTRILLNITHFRITSNGPRAKVLDESRSFFRVHTGYFSNIPKCIKAEFIASWGCSQKAFDRVWINGLTFKLITFKIPHPLIHLIHSYLTNRSFRIRINETLSNEHSVSAGCPQDSLLGPLLFNLYINDIPDYSLTKINLYADDTAIHATYKNLKTISFALNKHLLLLQNFYDKWKISINVEKSTAIIFTKKQSLPPPIIMYNTQIPWSQEAKYLGIIFDTHLTWKQHIYYVRDKFRKIMFKLYPLIGRNSHLSIENKVLLYTAVMRPILAYACPVWGYAAKTNINILDTLQNSLIRMIVKAIRYMRNDDIHEESYPLLPDSIAQPIAIMPLSRMLNSTFAMPNIIDSHDMGLRTVLQSRRPKVNAHSTPIQLGMFSVQCCIELPALE
ncbi:probable RNA-directed DNA polymerase from transposon X-element [Trichonephila clavipes]|nr:probable RNA-directed DNA polymerase from transposon X-element [Trichonephila clavipes]